jgi:hypothetical protein
MLCFLAKASHSAILASDEASSANNSVIDIFWAINDDSCFSRKAAPLKDAWKIQISLLILVLSIHKKLPQQCTYKKIKILDSLCLKKLTQNKV